VLVDVDTLAWLVLRRPDSDARPDLDDGWLMLQFQYVSFKR
jgi:hypothetical protein